MSDKDVPIQQWWPNFPNPVQMFLCIRDNPAGILRYNDRDIKSNYCRNTDVSNYNPPQKEAKLVIESASAIADQEEKASLSAKEIKPKPERTSKKKAHRKKSPTQLAPSTSNPITNEKTAKNSNTAKSQNMRPYKKRSFHSHLQNSESNGKNDDDEAEKQLSSSPPIEDSEKDKDDDTKKRKRWKRKISRKQFRHHDIKLFTPGEYRTSSLLKQKDSNPNVPKKPETVSKEAITEMIVTSLAGHKQGSNQKKGQNEEMADSTTKTDTEENNNTNCIQNNNNVGKHILPAIIIETPSVRRRSVDNASTAKTTLKTAHQDQNFGRSISVDMPLLNQTQKEKEHEDTQKSSVIREQFNVKRMVSRKESGISSNVEAITSSSSDQHVMEPLAYDSRSNETAPRSMPMEYNSPQRVAYAGHFSKSGTSNIQSQDPELMDTSQIETQNEEPQNLSLRHEDPVDLSKKSSGNESLSSGYRQQKTQPFLSYPQNELSSPTVGTSNQSSHPEDLGRNGVYEQSSQRTASNFHYEATTSSNNIDAQALADSLKMETILKITNVNMWKEVLLRLMKQKFTVKNIEMMAHIYEKLDKAKEESCVSPELKLEAQKLLTDAYTFLSYQLRQLNPDVNPLFVMKVLSQTENTPEKVTLQNYMANIQSIRELALDETRAASSKVPTTQHSAPLKSSQNRAEVPRSPIFQYPPTTSQIRYHHEATDPQIPNNPVGRHVPPPRYMGPHIFDDNNHRVSQTHRVIKSQPSSKTSSHQMPTDSRDIIDSRYHKQPTVNIHSLPPDHSEVLAPHSKSLDYRVPSNYSRGSSPKGSDISATARQPREPSPRKFEHSMPQTHPRGPSPRSGDHPIPVLPPPPQRAGQYSFGPPQGLPSRHEYNNYYLQGYSQEPPMIMNNHIPVGAPDNNFSRPRAYPQLQHNSRIPPLRLGDHPVPPEHTVVPQQNNAGPPMRREPSEPASVRSSDHILPPSYPRDLQFQPSNAYINYFSKVPNRNTILDQTRTTEPPVRRTSLGRPRSKSHRNVDSKSNQQPNLKRSLSNTQHTVKENGMPAPASTYVPEAINRSAVVQVPTSTNNFYPLIAGNNSVPSSVINTSKKEVSMVPRPSQSLQVGPGTEYFYQNLVNHMEKGNPIPVSIHPFPGYPHKIPTSLPNNIELPYSQNSTAILDTPKVQPKIVNHKNEPMQVPEPSIPSNVEEKCSSSTDHLEISKISKVPEQPVKKNEPVDELVPQAPIETVKTIPAVIVADTSMQITKETTASSVDGQIKQISMDVLEDTNTRISISSNSNENTSSSEENIKRAFEAEPDENNTEFLVWLEKLKSNEKLKSKFLSQMGIIKKEEPIFIPDGDTIEIVDSDEEDSSDPTPLNHEENNHKQDQTLPKLLNDAPSQVQESKQLQSVIASNNNEDIISNEVPIQPEVSSNTYRSNTISPSMVIEEPTRTVPRESLSKNDCILPIPLPYIPPSSSPNVSYPATHRTSAQKVIYSPEIEPISPVGSEPSFVFPEVTNRSKPLAVVNVTPGETPDDYSITVTSPTYAKRKTFSDFRRPSIEEDEARYSVDKNAKRKKSLDRPGVIKSPRLAPAGKLCYVRESHMFLRYFDDTQVELFIRNMSTQDEELLRTTGIDPDSFKSARQPSKFGADQLAKTEIIYLPKDVEFSEKEDIQDVEEFIKECALVERHVPRDFGDFYRYVTGFQIIKNKHPVSLQTFLTMYNTNRTSELLRKYIESRKEF